MDQLHTLLRLAEEGLYDQFNILAEQILETELQFGIELPRLKSILSSLYIQRHDVLVKALVSTTATLTINQVLEQINYPEVVQHDLTPDHMILNLKVLAVKEMTISQDTIAALDKKKRKYDPILNRIAQFGYFVKFTVYIFHPEESFGRYYLYDKKANQPAPKEPSAVETFYLNPRAEKIIQCFTKVIQKISQNPALMNDEVLTSTRNKNHLEFARKIYDISPDQHHLLKQCDPEYEQWLENYSYQRNTLNYTALDFMESFQNTVIPQMIEDAKKSAKLHEQKNNDFHIDFGKACNNNFYIPNHDAIQESFKNLESRCAESYQTLLDEKPWMHFMWTDCPTILLQEEDDTKLAVMHKFSAEFDSIKERKTTLCRAIEALTIFPKKTTTADLKEIARKNGKKVTIDNVGNLVSDFTDLDNNPLVIKTMTENEVQRFSYALKKMNEEIKDFLYIGRKHDSYESDDRVKTLPIWDEVYLNQVYLRSLDIADLLTAPATIRKKLVVHRRKNITEDSKEWIEYVEKSSAYQMLVDSSKLWSNIQAGNTMPNKGYKIATCANKYIFAITGDNPGLVRGARKNAIPSVPVIFVVFVPTGQKLITGLRIEESYRTMHGTIYISQALRLNKNRILALAESDIKFSTSCMSMDNALQKNRMEFFGRSRPDYTEIDYKLIFLWSTMAAVSVSSRSSGFLDHIRYLVPNACAFLSNAPGYIEEKMQPVAKNIYHVLMYRESKRLLSDLFAAMKKAKYSPIKLLGDQSLSVAQTGILESNCPSIIHPKAKVRDYVDSMCIIYTLFFCTPKALHEPHHRDIGFYKTPIKYETMSRQDHNCYIKNKESVFYFDPETIKYTSLRLNEMLSDSKHEIRNTFAISEKWDQNPLTIKTLSSLRSSLSTEVFKVSDKTFNTFQKNPKKQLEEMTSSYAHRQRKKAKALKSAKLKEDFLLKLNKMIADFKEKIIQKMKIKALYHSYIAHETKRVLDNVAKMMSDYDCDTLIDLTEIALGEVDKWVADLFNKGQRTEKDREIYRMHIMMKIGLYMVEHFYKSVAMYCDNEVISEAGDEKILDMQRRNVNAEKIKKVFERDLKANNINDMTTHIYRFSLDMTKWSPSDNTLKYMLCIIYNHSLTTNEKKNFLRAIRNLRKKKLLFNNIMDQILLDMTEKDQLSNQNEFYKITSDFQKTISEMEENFEPIDDETSHINPEFLTEDRKVKNLEKNWFEVGENWLNGSINYFSSINQVQAMLLFKDCVNKAFPNAHVDFMAHSDDNMTIVVVVSPMSELQTAYFLDSLLTDCLKRHCWKISDKKSYFSIRNAEFVSQHNINHEQKALWVKGAMAAAAGSSYISYEVDFKSAISKIMAMDAQGAPKNICEVLLEMMIDKLSTLYGINENQKNCPAKIFDIKRTFLPIELGGIPTAPIELYTLAGPNFDYYWKIRQIQKSKELSNDQKAMILKIFGDCFLHNSLSIPSENYEGDKVSSLIKFGLFIDKNKVLKSDLNKLRISKKITQEDLKRFNSKHPSYQFLKPTKSETLSLYYMSKLYNPNFARSYSSQRPEQLKLDRMFRKHGKCCSVQSLFYKQSDKDLQKSIEAKLAKSGKEEDEIVDIFEDIIEEDLDLDLQDDLQEEINEWGHQMNVRELEIIKEEVNKNIQSKAKKAPTKEEDEDEVNPENIEEQLDPADKISFDRERYYLTLVEAFTKLQQMWQSISLDASSFMLDQWMEAQFHYKEIYEAYEHTVGKNTKNPKRTIAIKDPKNWVIKSKQTMKPMTKVLSYGLDKETFMENDWFIEEELPAYDQDWLTIEPKVTEIKNQLAKAGITEPERIYSCALSILDTPQPKARVFFVNQFTLSYSNFVCEWINNHKSDYFEVSTERYYNLKIEEKEHNTALEVRETDVAMKAYLFAAIVAKGDLDKLKELCCQIQVRDKLLIQIFDDLRSMEPFEKRTFMVPLYYLFGEINHSYQGYNYFIPLQSQTLINKKWVGDFIYFYKQKYNERDLIFTIHGTDNMIHKIVSNQPQNQITGLIEMLKKFKKHVKWHGKLEHHIKYLRKTHGTGYQIVRFGMDLHAKWTKCTVEAPKAIVNIVYDHDVSLNMHVQIEPSDKFNCVYVSTYQTNDENRLKFFLGQAKKYLNFKRNVSLRECSGVGFSNFIEFNTWFKEGLADKLLQNRYFHLNACDVVNYTSTEHYMSTNEFKDFHELIESDNAVILQLPDQIQEIELEVPTDRDDTKEDVEFYETIEDYMLLESTLDLRAFKLDDKESLKCIKRLFNLLAHITNGRTRIFLWNVCLVILYSNKYDDLGIEQDWIPKKNGHIMQLYNNIKLFKDTSNYKNLNYLIKELINATLDWFVKQQNLEFVTDDDV